MHTIKFLRLFTNKQLLQFIWEILTLLVLSNISACACKQYMKPNASSMNMTINQRLLVGNENRVKIIFGIGDSSNTVAIESFKLKVSIVEQQGFTGAITGSQIKYKNAAGTEQAFPKTFEKQLSEFTPLLSLDRNNGLTEFKVNFDVLPSTEVIKLKLKFELLDALGNSILDLDVEWIKGAMVLGPITPFKAKKASFKIKSLKGDISDLNKIILKLQSDHANVLLLVGKDKKQEASLAELLPHATELIKDKESDPIKIVINDLGDKEAIFSILAIAADVLTTNSPVTEEHIRQIKLEQDAGIKHEEQDQEIDQELKELEETKEKEQLEEQQSKKIEEKKGSLKEEKEKLKDKKGREEKEAIEKNNKKKKEKVLKVAVKKVNKGVNNKAKYGVSFSNAFAHNAFGIPLKEPKTEIDAKAHERGHKAGLIIGRIETAVGPTIVGIGLATMIAGTGPTLGGISVIALPMVAAGSGILAHGLYTANEAQTSIDNKKEKDKEDKSKQEMNKNN